MDKPRKNAIDVANILLLDFGNLITAGASAATGAGKALSFINSLVGIFSKTANASTTATSSSIVSYNLVLNGSMTTKTVVNTFLIRVPGTRLISNTSNLTYYACPMGVFNLNISPKADTLLYDRISYWAAYGTYNTIARKKYISLRIKNDVPVTYNLGAGVELVSVQAAIVGQVPQISETSINPMYDPFSTNHDPAQYPQDAHFNYMLPDFEANRLELVNFDSTTKYHTFQTPYVNLECMNGMTFNAIAGTIISFRVKAILKRINDPSNAPIYFIKDYQIDQEQGMMSATQRLRYAQFRGYTLLPPYNNYTYAPVFISDKELRNIYYNASSVEERGDNSIESFENVTVGTYSNITFRAGGNVTINPGFSTSENSVFIATTDVGNFYNITCGVLSKTGYQHPDPCYNSNVYASKTEKAAEAGEVATHAQSVFAVYPNPSAGSFTIKIPGSSFTGNAQIVLINSMGQAVFAKNTPVAELTNGFTMNAPDVANGLYLLKIINGENVYEEKIIIKR